MKHILNIGFVVEPGRYADTLAWLRDTGARIGSGQTVRKSELLEVVEVPGDPDFGKETRNISLQLTFDELTELHAWVENEFGNLAEAYSEQCGEPLIFMTVLKPV